MLHTFLDYPLVLLFWLSFFFFFWGFFTFWGVVFLISTTLVMLLKKEKDCTEVSSVLMEKSDMIPVGHCRQHILDAYKQLLKISRLPSVFSLMAMLLTIKVNIKEGGEVSYLFHINLSTYEHPQDSDFNIIYDDFFVQYREFVTSVVQYLDRYSSIPWPV